MAVEGERELEEFLSGSGALNPDGPTATEEEEVVYDDRPGAAPPEEKAPPTSPEETPAEEEVEPPDEEEEAEEVEEATPHVAWAKQKYGEDTERWAKAMYDQEQFIGRLSSEKTQAEEVAREAIQYAQQVEAQGRQMGGMPVSAQEEAWIEENLANPAGAAYTAARSGNVNLYNAVIERIAEMNPTLAAQVGTQVQLSLRDEAMRMQQAQAQQNGAAGASGDLRTDLGASFQRLGIDVTKHGDAMYTKLAELGEYHPYTLAILGGDPMQRDLAVQAVYDLTQATGVTARRMVDTEREAQIAREAELRRGAAGVVTGGTHVTAPPPQSPFMQAMEDEWRKRGHLPAEE